MSFQSLSYFAFLPVVAFVYLHLPKRWQSPLLAGASLAFFALCTPPDFADSGAAFRSLLPWATLAFMTAFVWFAGQAAARGDAAKRGRAVRRGVVVLLALLAVFKYYNLSPLPTLFWGTFAQKLPFPLGISFTSFAAIGYLIDVGRGDAQPAKRPVDLFVFLFFFGTITSGPICRAGQLLPQLETEHRFDTNRTVRAGQLFALGLFKKVAVADVLALFADEVFAHLGSYGAPVLLLALLFYTFQLYFDFCGYSEMARATGLFLGLELPENFKTPFFATNFSGFWSRWHISLSSWLQDYLFTTLVWLDASRLPLIGKKYDRLPVEFCVFSVFFLSGFWHGNTLPFVVWGLLQAVYRVGEELLHRRFGKPKKRGVPNHILWGKRAVVFVLWAFGMIFFRVGSGPNTPNGLGDAAAFFAGLGRGWAPADFAAGFVRAVQTGFYANNLMTAAYVVFVVFTLGLCFWLDGRRAFGCKNASAETVLNETKTAPRWALYYILVICILAGFIIQNGGFGGGTSFSYANF